MDSEGPFPRFTLIFCRDDEAATLKIAAFPDEAEASEHARLRLLALPEDWISVVVAGGIGDSLCFCGAWDRHPDGLRWEDASMA